MSSSQNELWFNSGSVPMHGPALKITDYGLEGLVVEHTEHFLSAVTSHEQLVGRLDAGVCFAPGAMLVLLLSVNEFILCKPRLKAATAGTAQAYKSQTDRVLEFSMEGGWRDRRILSEQTANFILANGGAAASAQDWKAAEDFLRQFYADFRTGDIWQRFLDDAQAWWSQHLPGPVFAHAIGRSSYQMLDRSSWARRATGLPQKTKEVKPEGQQEDDVSAVHATIHYSDSVTLFDELVNFAGQVAREKPAKSVGRARILEKAQQLTPVARAAGRGQLIVLGGIKHALKAGGVRGDMWAPITVYEYLRQGIKDLAKILVRPGLDAMSGEGFHREYKELLNKVKESQRPKLEAFLLAFHRFLLLSGFEPLPRALSGKQELLPPMAAVVTDRELALAREYVVRVAPDERIALQARLGLLLGFWIPLRTVELWCLRVGDAPIKPPMYLVIYPRQRDGTDKTEALRREEDVESIPSTELKTALIDMVNMRLSPPDYATPEDFLFGRPGFPDERHEQLATTQLMNEALRWATGRVDASYYDLRHTIFSRRAEAELLKEINGQ